MVGVAPSPRRQMWELLQEFRRRAGLTQHQLAELAGMSVAALRDLEQGRVSTPRPGTLDRLVEALQLPESETEQLNRLGRTGRTSSYGLWLRMLGPLTVEVGGAEVGFGSGRQRILLGVLSLAPNVPVSRDVLIEAAWGGQAPANVVELLQTNMSRLRRRLQPAKSGEQSRHVLTATNGGYQLNVTGDQLDMLAFRELTASARRSRDDGSVGEACELYREALQLWHGYPLDDLTALRTHPAVVALSQEWQGAVLDYADTAAELGRYEEVVPLLRQAVAEDPLSETAHARLMIALAGSGQQAAALTLFQQLRHRLADELGTDPGRELQDAHQRILRHEITRAEEAGTAIVSAYRQLPPDTADFSGRRTELAALHNSLPDTAGGGTAVPISVIEGMVGVGKTRVALRFAHQLLERGLYADCQLYVDLHGYSEQPPADPGAVLISFLRLLGVPADQIPRDLDERVALYRDRIYSKNALVLLDNAASEEQVHPLLPAGPTNLVVITSRRTLALDGAHTLPLAGFTQQEAQDLFVRVAGRERVHADPLAARHVIELCGGLPLALSLVARRLQARPSWGFTDAADRIRLARDRLGELAAGSRRVRVAFDLSYEALPEESQQVFRALGVHPGCDFSAGSVAALAGVAPALAQQHLDVLVDEHLVVPLRDNRYQLHDLLREYARGLVERFDASARDTMLERLLHWYLHATSAARSLLPPNGDDLQLDDQPPSHVPEFIDDDEAFGWLDMEHATIATAVSTAYQNGFPKLAWQLAVALACYFDRASNWEQWLETGNLGLRAARSTGNRGGEASVLNVLGSAYGKLGYIDKCVDLINRSLSIRSSINDLSGQAQSLNNLGIGVAMRGSLNEAIECFSQALEVAPTSENPHRTAGAVSNLGRAYFGLGDHQNAARYLEQALETRRSLSDDVGTALTLHILGEVYLDSGEHDAAIELLQQACEIHRRKHCRAYEAETLETLGNAFHRVGKLDRAIESWRAALSILDSLSHTHASELREILGQVSAGSGEAA